MKSGSQPAALTLLDLRPGHIAFQLQKFTLAAGSVFSERSNNKTLANDRFGCLTNFDA